MIYPLGSNHTFQACDIGSARVLNPNQGSNFSSPDYPSTLLSQILNKLVSGETALFGFLNKNVCPMAYVYKNLGVTESAASQNHVRALFHCLGVFANTLWKWVLDSDITTKRRSLAPKQNWYLLVVSKVGSVRSIYWFVSFFFKMDWLCMMIKIGEFWTTQ